MLSCISVLFHRLLNIPKLITSKRNFSFCLLFFCCSFLTTSITACNRFDNRQNTDNRTRHTIPKDIADTDFGSTILSLLTPENSSVELSDKDIQAAFSYFCKQTFLNEISSDSISLHYTLAEPKKLGISDFTPSFGETNTHNQEAVSAENYLYLLSLFPYDSLTKEQKLTYEIFRESLEDSISLAIYELYAEPLSKTVGIQAQLPVLLSEYAFYCKQDVEDYLELLTHLPAYFEQLALFEEKKAQQGLFMHKENALAILKQCEEMVLLGNKKDRKNFLITSFEERIVQLDQKYSIAKEQKDFWMKKNKQVLKDFFYPAYAVLGKTFQNLLTSGKNTGGLAGFTDGKDYYEALVRHNTGSDRSIAQLKKLINDRILLCASKITKTLTDDTAMEQALSEADAYSLPFPDAGHTLSYLKTQLSDAFPLASQISCAVLSVPDSLSEYLSPAFYLIPPVDLNTENCIYINESQIHDDLSFFTTLAHEGYPGHLYQNAMFQVTEPELLRTLLSYPGYSEGWASYTELLSYEFSGLSDDAVILQQNNMLLTLCMYAMCDIYIHYDGYTEEDIRRYLNSFGITDENAVHALYLQILAEPANYLKYSVGCLEFLVLREEMEKIYGDSFELRTFHETILTTGPCSFTVLHKQLLSKN